MVRSKILHAMLVLNSPLPPPSTAANLTEIPAASPSNPRSTESPRRHSLFRAALARSALRSEEQNTHQAMETTAEEAQQVQGLRRRGAVG